MIHPYEADREFSTGELLEDFCDICGYKQCQCEEIETTVHAQERRDAQQKIDNYVAKVRKFQEAIQKLNDLLRGRVS